MRSPNLRQHRNGIGGRALHVRRVERDDAGDPVRIAHGRLPHDIAAPVVADDDRLVDPKMVEDSDDVAGQTVDRM